MLEKEQHGIFVNHIRKGYTMFPKMRRYKAEMSKEETVSLLERCDEGVLGTIGTNGYPHTVPINYVYYNEKIYMHSAKEGFKLSNIEKNQKVSFTVYDNVYIDEEKFTTKYESAIVYGIAKVIPGNKEVLMELIKKYSNSFLNEGFKYVEKSFDTTFLIEITIEHMTGKIRKRS
jgi:nitroimidazol reductase NimA-like FMN-containing flavoprotein (pyridoxamine 5'-phosphate oxidase superfamily)